MRLLKEIQEIISFPIDRFDDSELQEKEIAERINYKFYSGMFNNVWRVYKEREYKNGLLIRDYWLKDGLRDLNIEEHYENEIIVEYDNQNRITFEKETKNYRHNYIFREIFHTEYLHNNESYVAIRKKKYSGLLPCTIDGETTYCANKPFQKIDEIVSIHEFKKVNGCIKWEKLTSLIDGKSQLTKYHYVDDINAWDDGSLEAITGPHIVEKFNCIKSTFNNEAGIEKHYLDSDTICLQIRNSLNGECEKLELLNYPLRKEAKEYKKTLSKNGLIIEVDYLYSNYEYFDKEEIFGPVIKELFEYDSSSNLICINYFSLKKGALFLYKKEYFEYGSAQNESRSMGSDSGGKNSITRIITKMHISRNKKEISSNVYCEPYFFNHNDIQPEDIEEDFIITNAKYNIYNLNNQIIEEREFKCKKLVNAINYSYDDRSNCIYKETFKMKYSMNLKLSEYDIYEYNELNEITSHINLDFSHEGISTQKIKRFYYES